MKQIYWFNKKCCVHACFNSSTEGQGCYKEYFDLPAEPQARKRWLSAILIEDGEDLKICEDHFQNDDVFRDKNNRKKLRVNSIPSLNLPKPNVCISCHNLKNPSTINPTSKVCQCGGPLTLKRPLTTEESLISEQPLIQKRSRMTWTVEEKKTLFKVIKGYGDVKLGTNKIRINWTNVANHCRANGCFGNEKELKSVWQYMRVNAAKVYRNEIFGSKLDRKVSRFLFGKSSRKSRRKLNNNNNNETDGTSNQNLDVSTTEEEEQRNLHPMVEGGQEEELVPTDSTTESGIVDEDIEEEGNANIGNDEESDEYYTLSDVEEIYHIKIRPRQTNEPKEVISLVSSDED